MRWLDGREFEQALGAGDGQGRLASCSPWGHKESDMTEQLNLTEREQLIIFPKVTSMHTETHLICSII